MPLWLWLIGGSAVAWWLLKPSQASGGSLGYYTPPLSVAASDSPTTPGYCVIGTNQYGQNALGSGNGCFVPPMIQQQVPFSLDATPSVGDNVTASAWYQASGTSFALQGSVSAVDAMGNVTARVTALSANPATFGESISVGDSITLPQGYWTQGSFGPSTPQYGG